MTSRKQETTAEAVVSGTDPQLPRTFAFDRYEHSTILCALIHYGMTVADPDECIALLERISPVAERSWSEMLTEARENLRAMNKEAVRAELESSAQLRKVWNQ